MKKLLFFLLFVVAGVHAQASKTIPDISTGNGFVSECSVATEKDVGSLTNTEVGYCLGYIKGLRDGLLLVENKAYCIPDGVTTGQMLSILVKYVRENPETAHELNAVLLAKALHLAFPCK